ncbi:MAG: L-glutamate gamma-semialdehyde dehydrogenase [Acidimicrobiia bacterium]|jgi:1-pyrroline-5-carboxylate dehydrogenase
MNGIVHVPPAGNEPALDYLPGSPERTRLEAELRRLSTDSHDLPMAIGTERTLGGGEWRTIVQPHDRHATLGRLRDATAGDVERAVAAATEAAHDWGTRPFEERAAVFLNAAALLAGPWRDRLNAATMLGQSKTAHQAEIDAACELIDFWRFNVAFARRVLDEQPLSSPGTWNRVDYRPLEGFVCAITPFNFTSIAGNLPTAPALMGNTVVWKPSTTQQLAAHVTMELLVAAGLPPGVVNMVTGSPEALGRVALTDPRLAGIHFTGSTTTFRHLWKTVADHLDGYRSFPRLVGETGGKNFVLAHPSADPAALRTALIRGAFEYQGQKCSAAGRAYVPASLWRDLEADLVAETDAIPVGDVRDLSNFMGAVIDETAFTRLAGMCARADSDPALRRLTSRVPDDRDGWFVPPTIYRSDDPAHDLFVTELFGPILAVFVYDDDAFDDVVRLVDSTSPYGLTGSVFAGERAVLDAAARVLRHAAGNLYFNDKPTGAVVGQQPFGGSRASGTNDKAGTPGHLLRWVSPRTIKETFAPPTDYRYPFMATEG